MYRERMEIDEDEEAKLVELQRQVDRLRKRLDKRDVRAAQHAMTQPKAGENRRDRHHRRKSR